MTVKLVPGLSLFPIRDAAKGFLISLRASNRYAPSYLEALERSLAFLSTYAEAQAWPSVDQLTTGILRNTWPLCSCAPVGSGSGVARMPSRSPSIYHFLRFRLYAHSRLRPNVGKALLNYGICGVFAHLQAMALPPLPESDYWQCSLQRKVCHRRCPDR